MPKQAQPTAPATLVVVSTPSHARPVDLAKLDGDKFRAVGEFDPADLGRRAVAMIDQVDALDRERAQKAILAGIFLHQVKLALPYGQFGKWIGEHFCNSCKTGASPRTAYNTMALAEKFCRASKLILPELVAARQLSLQLEAPGEVAAGFVEKLRAFVGTAGLTELYRRHGVIKQGGLRGPSPAPTAAEGEGDPAPSTTPEALAYQQMVDAISAASAVLLDPVRWSMLTPETAEQVAPLVAKLAADFNDRRLRARHEATA